MATSLIVAMSDLPPKSASQALRPPGRKRMAFGLIALFTVAGFLVWGNLRWPTPVAEGTTFSADAPRPADKTLRLAYYNIHGGVGEDGQRDMDRIADDLGGFDLIGLSEVHGGFSGNQASELGQRTRLPFLFAPSERRWWHDSFGNGALCAIPVDKWIRTPLLTQSTFGFRSTLLVRARLDGQPLNVLIAHLTRRDDRQRQLTAVMRQFIELPKPAVLMGDLNTLPGDAMLNDLMHGQKIIDALSGRRGNKACVDWIFVRGLQVIESGLIHSGASDHPLAWAQVRHE